MIAWLQGVLLEKQAPLILLNVNGVGYELEAPLSAFYDLPNVGDITTLYVHMVVREDAQLLYAFADQQQRDVFRSLIKVNGVGPKVALAVLSTLSVQELMQCMADDDFNLLCKVPGIGKKTAQRLVVELKDRLEKNFGDSIVVASPGEASKSDRDDATAALESLGYKNKDASRVVRSLGSELSSEEMIREALKILSGKVL
ncbi:MAG: Holliday junction branch migration protein RuvA [Acidiferrobacterales bacterium]|nr:Holliday junction branch migration protein RuvA [Acidiferrobacterales bacterium]